MSPEQYGEMKARCPKFNDPWTEDEVEELRSMAADGLPRTEMAGQLGRTPNAVKLKLQSLGLYIPKPAARPWTEEDDGKLVRMYLEGVSFAALAATFGRSEKAVITRLVLLRAGLRREEA